MMLFDHDVSAILKAIFQYGCLFVSHNPATDDQTNQTMSSPSLLVSESEEEDAQRLDSYYKYPPSLNSFSNRQSRSPTLSPCQSLYRPRSRSRSRSPTLSPRGRSPVPRNYKGFVCDNNGTRTLYHNGDGVYVDRTRELLIFLYGKFSTVKWTRDHIEKVINALENRRIKFTYGDADVTMSMSRTDLEQALFGKQVKTFGTRKLPDVEILKQLEDLQISVLVN